jgi:hypothetical protein
MKFSHVSGEKKTSQPATEQCYRLVSYTQNATGNMPFSLKIYYMIISHKNHKLIMKNLSNYVRQAPLVLMEYSNIYYRC